jgi:hypothetical protein
VLVLNAIAAAIIDEDLVDHEFVARRVDGFEDFARFIRDYAPEVVGPSCGLDADDIRSATRICAPGRPSMSFHGLGLTEHRQGTEGVMSLINLAYPGTPNDRPTPGAVRGPRAEDVTYGETSLPFRQAPHLVLAPSERGERHGPWSSQRAVMARMVIGPDLDGVAGRFEDCGKDDIGARRAGAGALAAHR